MAAESKDLFAFRRGFTDLLPNRSLDYARDDSLVRNLKQLDKLQFVYMVTKSIPDQIRDAFGFSYFSSLQRCWKITEGSSGVGCA